MLPPRHHNQGFELGFAPCPLTNDGAPHALNVLRAVLEGLRALKHEHRMLVRRVLLPLHAPAWATAGCGHTASCADGGGGSSAALTNGGMGGFVGNGNGGPPERLGYSGAANGNLRLYHGALRDATAAAVRKEPALAVEVVRGLARRWPRAGAAEKTLALLEELRLVLSLARGPQLALLRAPLLRCLLLATGGSGAASATAVASASALAYHTVRFAETQPARGAPHAASNGRASATAAAAEEEEAEASFSVGGGAWMTARQVRCRASNVSRFAAIGFPISTTSSSSLSSSSCSAVPTTLLCCCLVRWLMCRLAHIPSLALPQRCVASLCRPCVARPPR